MQQKMERILARVPGWSVSSTMVTPLEGGITNRNYRVEVGKETFVLRMGGEGSHLLGIVRRHEYQATLTAAKLGIGPEVVHFLEPEGVLITRFIQGTAVTAEAAARPEMLRRIVHSIKRCHGGPPFPSSFSPFETVRSYHALALKRGVSFPPAISDVLDLLGQIERGLGPMRDALPCHNDLLAANFIDDGKTIFILDWEYAGMGDRFFDLGNFAANQRLGRKECELMLQHYFGHADEKDMARLYLMRLASDLRESMWGFLQSGISKLDFDFKKYAQDHLNRFLKNSATLEFSSWLRAVT